MIKQTVLEVLKKNKPEIDITENSKLIEDGLLDSFDIVAIVSDLDKTFGISIDGAKILPEYFNTVDDIVRLVKESRK